MRFHVQVEFFVGQSRGNRRCLMLYGSIEAGVSGAAMLP